jgi:hypothetical protein
MDSGGWFFPVEFHEGDGNQGSANPDRAFTAETSAERIAPDVFTSKSNIRVSERL